MSRLSPILQIPLSRTPPVLCNRACKTLHLCAVRRPFRRDPRLIESPIMLAAYRSVGRRMRAPGHVRFASAISGLNLPAKYGHFIGGKFVEPVGGEYFDNVSPIDGQKFIQAARGSKADVDDAVRAANEAYW